MTIFRNPVMWLDFQIIWIGRIKGHGRSQNMNQNHWRKTFPVEPFISILQLVQPWERPAARISKAGQLCIPGQIIHLLIQHILSGYGTYCALGTMLGAKDKRVNQTDHSSLPSQTFHSSRRKVKWLSARKESYGETSQRIKGTLINPERQGPY